MTSTTDLTAILGHVEQAGAKLLLTGGHRQLAAVGSAAAWHSSPKPGPGNELTETRRFTPRLGT